MVIGRISISIRANIVSDIAHAEETIVQQTDGPRTDAHVLEPSQEEGGMLITGIPAVRAVGCAGGTFPVGRVEVGFQPDEVGDAFDETAGGSEGVIGGSLGVVWWW